MSPRQIILDTETTGLEPEDGHRIIEIGCVELINRRLTGNTFHQYLNPDRPIDEGAIEVHGITREFLEDKPRFAQIVEDFITFVNGAELIIHNAPFDVGFINHELKLIDISVKKIESLCKITDTLVMARHQHPGQRNSLDALCKRYEIDNSQRTLHGALLDAEILADVYLAMTGGQVSLGLAQEGRQDQFAPMQIVKRKRTLNVDNLVVINALDDELLAHENYIKFLQEKSGDIVPWNDKK